jgi:tRNA threonylcarbamoyladenosine modification (KEOPS) complex  Pcc1 subunit
MNATATVSLKILPRKRLETVFNSVKPETTSVTTRRSHAVLEKKEKFLILKVEARDTVALRAALNAYLRWIDSVLGVLSVLESE